MKNRTITYLSGRFFDGISSGLFMMSLPWMMLKTEGMGSFVAIVALACTLISFFSAPFFSTLIDRHSRKSILVNVQLIQTFTAIAVLLSYLTSMDSIWLLALAQLVFWVSSNLAWTTNNAFTQENFEAHEYAAISGKQEIIMQSTTMGAGALGVMLLEVWSMKEFAMFAATASAIATLSYVFTPYRRRLRKSVSNSFMDEVLESKQIVSRQPLFFIFLMFSALSYPIITYLGKLVPIWFSEEGISGEWLAGYSMAFGAGALITGILIKKLLNLGSLPKVMMLSMSVSGVAILGMALSPHPIYLLAFSALFGLFNACNRIARTNWMHHTIAIEQRGRADGALQMFATMAQSLSYVVISMLSHYGVTQLGFALASVVMFVAIAVMYWVYPSISGSNGVFVKVGKAGV
ncbi:MFS transporter [Vibrio splendidus]